MKRTGLLVGLSLFAAVAIAADPPAAPATVCPAAIFPFQERGASVKGYGEKVSDVLFASLVVDPDLVLVERTEIEKILQEQELNISGLVSPDQAVKVGQMTGARILITGSIVEVDQSLYVVAKIIGTETSRVLGESEKGPASADIAKMVEALAAKISATIKQKSDQLVAKPVGRKDRVAAIKTALGDRRRPTVAVKVAERHIGQATIDPAVQTEFSFILNECGFKVVEPTVDHEFLVDGEAFSELSLRRGNLVSVKARAEIKAVEKATGKVVSADRQTAYAVDLAEQVAGKTALQEAASVLAERVIPKLVK